MKSQIDSSYKLFIDGKTGGTMKERTTNGKAIIVGAGIGGLVTGAILAEKEGWNLHVLDKERGNGGKCYSFEHFDGDEETFRHILFHNSRSKLVCSEPSLSELISHKVFGRYIFEGDWHSFIGAGSTRCRSSPPVWALS